jgi:hypothetical protein
MRLLLNIASHVHCALSNTRTHSQVQKVNSEELEAAIANRDKAILVDFFGALQCVVCACVCFAHDGR